MTITTLDPALKTHLDAFIKNVEERSPGNLKSVILYGGVAKNDYTEGRSNTNLLLVFESIDLAVLDQLSSVFQKAILDFRFSPFLLTTSELEHVKDVFAVKLFDIQQHHIVLFGNDLLQHLQIKPENLRFISEQEMRNQLARMKSFYILHFNEPERLLEKVQKGLTTLLVNANTLLFLKYKKYYSSRNEIIAHLVNEPRFDKETLQEFIMLRDGKSDPDAATIKQLYDRLMLQYKNLIRDFQNIDLHG